MIYSATYFMSYNIFQSYKAQKRPSYMDGLFTYFVIEVCGVWIKLKVARHKVKRKSAISRQKMAAPLDILSILFYNKLSH